MLKLVAGFLSFLAFVSLPSSGPAADPYEALSVLKTQKTPAPGFSLPQVEGKTVSLSDFRGKIVLLAFFKTF